MILEELKQQLNQRMNQLAAADPLCNRLMGRIEVIQEQKENNEPPELSIESSD